MYRFAVIGHTITYSKSPEIFSAILQQADAKGSCDIVSVESAELGDELARLQEGGFQGCSVTIPFKQSIRRYLTYVDRTAVKIGSINSVKLSGSTAEGFNTDWFGFVYSLKTARRLPARSRVLVIGSGGAASAVIYALNMSFGIKTIEVLCRSEQKLTALKRHFEPLLGLTLEPAAGTVVGAPKYDLVVNCTPVGGWNMAEQSPIPDGIGISGEGLYVDLNYNSDNRTVRRMRDRGISAIDGSTMLVAQAIRSFEIWTGKTVSFDPVYERVFGSAAKGLA